MAKVDGESYTQCDVLSEYMCNHCNKKVVNYTQCMKCNLYFHPKCLIQSATLKSAVCKHTPVGRVGEVNAKIIPSDTIVPGDSREFDLLVRIIEELEDKNNILRENNELLREKVRFLEASRSSRQNEATSPLPAETIGSGICDGHADSRMRQRQVTGAAAGSYADASRSNRPRVSFQSGEVGEMTVDGAKSGNVQSEGRLSSGLSLSPRIDKQQQMHAAIVSGSAESEAINNPENGEKAGEDFQLVGRRNKRRSRTAVRSSIEGVGQAETQHVFTKERVSKAIRNAKKTTFIGRSDSTSLQVAQRYIYKWFFVSRLDEEVTGEDITKFLKLQQDGNYVVEELKPRHENARYKSFKIGVPFKVSDSIMSPDIWPYGVFINRFFFGKGNVKASRPPRPAQEAGFA